MTEALDHSALARWRREPVSFIAEIMRDPETSRPFVLLDAERAFLQHAYQTDESGRLVFPEQLYGAPKKSGKTGFAAMHLLTTTLVSVGATRRAIASPTIWSKRRGAFTSPLAASARRRLICGGKPTSPSHASNFQKRVRQSRPSARTTSGAPVPIRSSVRSTSCGGTPPSGAASLDDIEGGAGELVWHNQRDVQ
jgi:hypothetical protein